ncbi:hypothetical protein FEE96_07115 [Parasedimentitalea maritima]|uniref:Uncharacterized protein n=1 Tax=Parasedimentitalea maritima TaxID=2578117 RepID=A0ABY2UXC0_9RHOB|nr:hypothetical protein [Zongyanglinia marina]TLP67110.1 hypothetical protein FEE96_07115 [Zongyanglinia marina]
MSEKQTQNIHLARKIALRPEEYIDDPSQFTTAWVALKAARGQSIDTSRLRAAHLIERPLPASEPTEVEKCLQRVAEKTRELIQARRSNLPPAA